MQVSRVCQSTGAVGSSADNTTAESFNTAFKRAPQRPEGLVERARARLDTFRRLTRYTTRRRHSHLGQRSPIEVVPSACSCSPAATVRPQLEHVLEQVFVPPLRSRTGPHISDQRSLHMPRPRARTWIIAADSSPSSVPAVQRGQRLGSAFLQLVRSDPASRALGSAEKGLHEEV
ncbi:integrase core domain-containing protein [Streptomyces sp. 3211]|uniref:integrase core domain-containing protein n=1 Tax=Streptomyces sp. 3211 TaxID=1964449 RepID=UPI0009A4A217